MLTRILKDNGILALLLTLGAVAGLLVGHAADVTETGMRAEILASHWAFGWCRSFPVITQILSGVLLISLAVITRFAGIRFRLLNSKGWLPVLITSCVALLYGNLLLRPDILLGALASQLTVVLILSTYRQDSVLSTLFHAGMLAGLAVLFHGPSFLMLAVIYFSIFILRSGAWREWLMPLIGLTMLLVLLMLVVIWAPEPLVSLRQILLSAWTVSLTGQSPHTGYLILLTLLALTLPAMLQDITSGAVQSRNGTLIMLSLMTIAVVMTLLPATLRTEAVVWAAFPVSIALSTLMERANRWWWADLLLVLLVTAVLLGHLS
jgi:hypothetical protein